MVKKIKALLKNQKGFTLVELLAVIVILGIIGAIAVPSIAGIIDNSKKDAHIANAQQMVSSARLAVAANDKDTLGTYNSTANTYTVTLKTLIDKGYLEDSLQDPDTGATYGAAQQTASKVVITKVSGTNSAAAKYTYTVTLQGTNRSIGQTTPVDPNDITRDEVLLTTAPAPAPGP